METKAKQIILYIIFSIMFFVCFIFAYSAKQIHFSHKSGFYDNEFYFSIKSPKNTKIFYTLDSSEPTVNSLTYSKPILIKDASSNPNVFSARSDMTFNNKNTPKSPVDKATILRVCVFDENNNLIKQDYRIFFVGFKNKKGYKNLPIVSVIMNPEDIIGEENGLLILGKKENPKEEDCWEDPVSRINFCAMGRSWERQAIIDIFDQNHRKILLSQKAGIRIKGKKSRLWIQKSMSLFARKEYANSNYFNKNILRKNTKIHNFVLFNGGDDIKTKLREFLIQTVESKTIKNVATMKMIPCCVFLNGEYWGVYYITENYNEQYISTVYNIQKQNILIQEKPNYPSYIYEIWDFLGAKMSNLSTFFTQTDMSDEKNYKRACEIIDMESFINYFATEIYIANSDWPDNNNIMWRTKYKDKNNKYADMKWRWMLFDVNSHATLYAYYNDTIERAIKLSPIFKSLIRNKTFREKFKQRIYYLETKVYTPKKMNKLIDKWLVLMKEPIIKSKDRFQENKSRQFINEEIRGIRIFFERRPEYINRYIDKHMPD